MWPYHDGGATGLLVTLSDGDPPISPSQCNGISLTPTPATVLTGFLGAGKTTLLNGILQAPHGLRIAAIVNDIGEVDVDAQLVQSVHGRVMSLWNGCICCDYAGDLRLSLLNLTAMANEFDHVVVEASGIADPVGISATFRVPELRERVRLDGIITVVDAEHARDPHLDPMLVRDQIAIADLVLLNKIDLVDAGAKESLHDWISGIASRTRIIETQRAEAPLAVVLGLDRATLPQVKARTYAHSDHFETWTFTSRTPLALHETVEALKSLPPSVFRAKGFLYLADAPQLRFIVQVVGCRVSTDILGPWDGNMPQTNLVFIGARGGTTAEQLANHLTQEGELAPS